jgi:hypothetical protein
MYWSITYALCDLVVGFVNYEEGWRHLLLCSGSMLVEDNLSIGDFDF